MTTSLSTAWRAAVLVVAAATVSPPRGDQKPSDWTAAAWGVRVWLCMDPVFWKILQFPAVTAGPRKISRIIRPLWEPAEGPGPPPPPPAWDGFALRSTVQASTRVFRACVYIRIYIYIYIYMYGTCGYVGAYTCYVCHWSECSFQLWYPTLFQWTEKESFIWFDLSSELRRITVVYVSWDALKAIA